MATCGKIYENIGNLQLKNITNSSHWKGLVVVKGLESSQHLHVQIFQMGPQQGAGGEFCIKM